MATDNARNALGRWLEARAPRWRETHGLLHRLRGKGPHGIDDAQAQDAG